MRTMHGDINMIHTLIQKNIDEVSQEIKEVHDEQLSELITILQNDVGRLKGKSQGVDFKYYLIALSSVENIISRLEKLKTQVPQKSNIIQKILSGIKNISQYIWNLICRIFTVDTWSIAGDLTGKPFGFGASVRLQINFKK